jgi:hypothetical protein
MEGLYLTDWDTVFAWAAIEVRVAPVMRNPSVASLTCHNVMQENQQGPDRWERTPKTGNWDLGVSGMKSRRYLNGKRVQIHTRPWLPYDMFACLTLP